MFSLTHSGVMQGFQPVKVEVEVNTQRGIPKLVIVGLPNQAVTEAKERVKAALINAGCQLKACRTIINLAPADVPKTSSTLELAMAVALLKNYGQFKQRTAQSFYLGELSLTGQLKPIKGALPLALAARKMGFKKLVLPAANLAEVRAVTGLQLYPLNNLAEYWRSPAKKLLVKTAKPEFKPIDVTNGFDLNQIQGQVQAKQALKIAAAGGHNLLMWGPPGCGKSILAQAIATILPPLNLSEAMAVTQIYSLRGLVKDGLIRRRPFRAPHHTISKVGLLGGNSNLMPGEISLAHHGVLFLDEICELRADLLEALRQPLQQGQIKLTRARGSTTYPAQFRLIAASNPCPCGYFNSQQKQCQCSRRTRQLYQQRISGAILDRIDLQVWVKQVKVTGLLDQSQSGQSSAEIRPQIVKALALQRTRYSELGDHVTNAQLDSSQVRQYLNLTNSGKVLLRQAANRLKLSARSYFKVIKVARTIADLAQEEGPITKQYLAQALSFRER